MSKVLDKAVSAADDDSGTHTFTRPVMAGQAGECGFVSSGWQTAKLAKARGQEHFDEHKTGEPAGELVEFRSKHGLDGASRLPEGTVTVEDL